mmetsp:Transcript_12677/g.36726  ORF Transcript_12677/g.36726 Transcript_12677/m.36726 type:complete len:214 (-) Transcript_12677:1537-2178(-)
MRGPGWAHLGFKQGASNPVPGPREEQGLPAVFLLDLRRERLELSLGRLRRSGHESGAWKFFSRLVPTVVLCLQVGRMLIIRSEKKVLQLLHNRLVTSRGLVIGLHEHPFSGDVLGVHTPHLFGDSNGIVGSPGIQLQLPKPPFAPIGNLTADKRWGRRWSKGFHQRSSQGLIVLKISCGISSNLNDSGQLSKCDGEVSGFLKHQFLKLSEELE